MKRQTIIFAVALLMAASFTSCRNTKKCHGGGWYNNRNLGYTPAKEQPVGSHLKLEEEVENCETAAP